MVPIKLIAMDLDDTLLNRKIEVSARNAQAIQKAEKAGIIVTLASGRIFTALQRFAEMLNLHAPLICLNGALVKDMETGKIYYKKPLNSLVANSILAYAKSKRYFVEALSEDQVVVREHNEVTDYYTRLSGLPTVAIGEKFFNQQQEIMKLLFITLNAKDLVPIAKDIKNHFQNSVTCVTSKENLLEIMEPNVDKWTGVKLAGDVLGIQPEEIMCIGDGLNDLSMVQNAGVGVAMANANPKVLKVAKWISTSNDKDGVALAIERILEMYKIK